MFCVAIKTPILALVKLIENLIPIQYAVDAERVVIPVMVIAAEFWSKVKANVPGKLVERDD